MGTRAAIGKAIEDEIRQRAEARRNSRLKHSSIVQEDLPQQEEGKAGEQYGRGKEKLQEGLPEAITGQSRDQVAGIVAASIFVVTAQ